jgi:hypothetical protein
MIPLNHGRDRDRGLLDLGFLAVTILAECNLL